MKNKKYVKPKKRVLWTCPRPEGHVVESKRKYSRKKDKVNIRKILNLPLDK